MAFDPAAATAAYIDGLGADALQKAAAYTTGNHWILLWGFLVGVLVTLIIVRARLLDRIDGKLAKRGPNLKAFVIGAATFLLTALIGLPWDIYTGWWRQKAYDMTSQPFGDWLMQGSISILISALLGGLFMVGVYALIRRTRKYWWLWAGGLTAGAFGLLITLAPVFIMPIFNEYKPVPAGEVRDALVKMADEAGIPEDHIFMYDGSRQSNNFTANVAGIGSTARIAISDIAMKGASLDEVKAVTGHEMGHYVLPQMRYLLGVLTLTSIACFFLIDRFYAAFARCFGSSAAISTPIGLPVLLLMIGLFQLFAQPVINSAIRKGETEADQYSLEHVNLPDALSSALVKTAEYRNPRPSELEEFMFYDHPSVERRVRIAMDWKAAHPPKE